MFDVRFGAKNAAKTKRRPKAYLMIETPVVACPFRAKLRRAQSEHMFSALPPNPDIARYSQHVSNLHTRGMGGASPSRPQCLATDITAISIVRRDKMKGDRAIKSISSPRPQT
jgi:hypothetical protein